MKPTGRALPVLAIVKTTIDPGLCAPIMEVSSMKRVVVRIVFVHLITLPALAGAPAVRHEDDFEVGLDPVADKIKVEFDPDNLPFELPASHFPLLSGFALDDPGFVSLEAGEAVPGVFEPLPTGAVIAFRLVSTSSPAFKVWNAVGPGEPGFQIIGDNLWVIGAPFFDEHPVWHIDDLDPTYNPADAPWAATFQLVQLAPGNVPGLAPSDPITVTFIPEPAAVALLALGAVAVRRTR